ncbi:hypothetical protein Tco_0661166 [Tanacetum coccineum]
MNTFRGKQGTDNQEKDEKQSQNDKTGLGMEKTVKDKAKSKQKSQLVKVKFINGPLSVILEAFGEISSYKLIELIAQGIEARAIRTGFLGHSLRKSGLGSETTKIQEIVINSIHSDNAQIQNDHDSLNSAAGLLLPSVSWNSSLNTITNPKEDLKGITTRSGVTIQGPKAFNHDTEVTKDKMPPANNGSTEDVQPPVVQIQSRNPNPEPNIAPVVTPASIPFPSRRNDEKRKEKANDQIEKFYEIFRDLSFEISFKLLTLYASCLNLLRL